MSLPDLILNYGPLIRFSSMRFERKHLYFKKLSHNLINRKNATKSLTYRHQRLKAITFENPRPKYHFKN